MKPMNSEMITIPLPLEIPTPPSLENIPLDILHSATVEMLLQQNDDLTSRLKVNIRRNSQLEQKILELELKIKEVLREQENYKSQFEIACEKESIWQSQKESKSRQTESLEKEITLLNLRYNELFSTTQYTMKQNQQDLVEKNELLNELVTKNEILLKIKSRSKDKLRQFLLEIAEKFQTLESELKKSQSTNRVLKNNFESLESEILEKENYFKQQFENFKDLSLKNSNTLELRNEELLANKEFLTSQAAELKQEVLQLKEALFQEKKGRIKIKQLFEEIGLLKNEKVKIRDDFDKKMTLIERNSQMNVERNKELFQQKNQFEKELFEQKTITETCESKMLELIKDNKEVSGQLETLQKLWIQTQEKLEQEELKRQSLEKINRELSQSYKENRVARAIQTANSDESHITPKHRSYTPKAELDL